MVDKALLIEIRALVDVTEDVLDLASTLRDEARQGQKAPYRKISRRLDKMANDLIKLMEEVKDA